MPSRPSRSQPPRAERRLAGALLALAAAWSLGCGSTAPRPALDVVGRDDAPYLISPLRGYPLGVAEDQRRELELAFDELSRGGDRAVAGRVAREALMANPGLHPAILLLAQMELLAGSPAAAEGRLRPILDELPGYTAAQLLGARVAEQLGDVVEAYALFRAAEGEVPLAAGRRRELEERVLEILSRRVDDAVARGRVEDARGELARLEQWAPGELATLRGRAAVAGAAGDLESELEAVRALAIRLPGDDALRERRADLELEVGDSGIGLQLLEELASARPDDARLADKLARARFRWRLVLLPPEMRDVVGAPELTRGDFAAMVYWLFPSVRYGRAGRGTIANDVFGHTRREEIVRVVNLGLMPVDETLHRFEPERPVTRAEALGAVLRWLDTQQPRPACLGPVPFSGPQPVERTCRAAVRCRFLEEEGDCLPAVTLAGSEAVELCQRALEELGE